MFDNHIQNIWVAQRKRGEEKNKEIEEEGKGEEGVERKSRWGTEGEGNVRRDRGMNWKIEKNRGGGAGGGQCSVPFILNESAKKNRKKMK